MRRILSDPTWARIAMLVFTACICVAGCKKESDPAEEPALRRSTPIRPPKPGVSSSAQSSTGSGAVAAAESAAEAAARATDLEARYRQAKDKDERIDLLNEMSDLPAVLALPVLERLFDNEAEETVRSEIVDELDEFDGEVDAKLSILRKALQQPGEVRESALDALQSVHDQKAMELWEPLLKDPNEETRAIATDAVEELKEAQAKEAQSRQP